MVAKLVVVGEDKVALQLGEVAVVVEGLVTYCHCTVLI